MFAPYCETHQARVLLSSSSIRAIHVDDHGIEVRFRCHCGAEGVWRTGARRATATAAAAGATAKANGRAAAWR